MEELKTQWHPAFCSAMELVLEEDREYLEFIREHNLNTKPLEVDLLIIKKPRDHQVKDKIGRIFKEHNIFEYKSPGDAMNIDTFYKVNAYAALYKASATHVDEIKANSVTITMIRDAKPEKLLIDLAKEGYTVRNPYKGIYYIGRKTNFATQIIVSKELSGRQYVWVKALTRTLDQEKARLLVEQARRCKSQKSRQLVDSVLAAIIGANKEMFGKLKEDAKMCEALRELMEDELNESKILGERIGEKIGLERGEKIGEKKGLKALVDVLKGMQLDFDSAYQSIIKTEAYAGVSKKQVMEYWQ
ncbi:MAG TPA: hypothetical protein DD414_09830 [Lachnospiraceae bacterium]|nr:hypothetical protein [Lachnospiraceae bacterium]